MVMVVAVMVCGEAHNYVKANGNGAACQFERQKCQKRTASDFPPLSCRIILPAAGRLDRLLRDFQGEPMKLRVLAVSLLVAATAAAQNSGGPAAAKATANSPQTIAHPQSISEKIAESKTRMDINTATAAQLKTLPGIGDAYAARIIGGRPYTAKNQLVQRGILPQNAYAAISSQIIAHRPKS
jgi:DNA uptake protein ComE-like DNA-binding protein